MKKILYIAVALFSVCFTQCTKPTKDFTFSINPKPFDHTVTMNFYDPKTAKAPANITLTITGQNANDVYEISGVKTYNVVDGIISLGLLYKANPTEGNPATFTVKAEAPGYLTALIPITIKAGQPIKLVNVSMVNIDNPPSGVNVQQTSTPLTGGSTATDVVIPPPADAQPGDQVVSIDIPSGTSFKDEAGNVITGSTLTSTVVSFGSTDPGSLSAFPGGTASDNIKDASGNTVAGRFRTAGFADITMAVGNTDVKTFSQPITLHMGIDGTQINPATGTLFAAGQTIPVWSYQIATGQWSYEQVATITNGANGLEASFPTSHLTYYNLAVMEDICNSSSIVFNTGLASSESFLVDIFAANEPNIPLVSGFLVQVANGGTVTFDNVPTGNLNVKVYRNTAANSQSNFMVRDGNPVGVYSGALCGSTPTITLSIPVLTPINFDIQGQCPNNSTNPIVRPTVDVWYRATGSGSAYQLLGQVQQGYFSTTNLSLNSTYDFKVIWGGNKVFLKTRNVDAVNYQRTIVVPQDQIATFCQ
ncbi:hypothetical protein F0919_00925 [Taibaiella lutea]|uniref:Uncharacterized protein n=1 Tax=Taibaiella lutea TaxID=2608001 RepID=A0A5M6CM19_9BACT|nr:hypothetical protein [Taibaiella lutea]KAA5536261.1 hypothetical protein F0919_00925 [Taibaiella lutea]